ncbi:MAG: S-adenosylmethionine:tRNA ribosyltransferase-isomerase, partial [Pirellulaceae bacterium]
MRDVDIDQDKLELYNYQLPRELIAQYPLDHRIDARLMRIDRSTQQISHHYVRDLPDLIEPGDALVLNNTKVIPARLVGFRTSTGGKWEGLYLREDPSGVWEVLSKTRGHLTAGETLTLRDKDGRDVLALHVVARLDDGHLAVRPIDEPTTSQALLERFGRV